MACPLFEMVAVMNDFTKDELNMMADGIVLIKEKCKISDITALTLDILDGKLCEMINNYCDHEPSDAHNEQFKWQLCSKCGCEYKINHGGGNE